MATSQDLGLAVERGAGARAASKTLQTNAIDYEDRSENRSVTLATRKMWFLGGFGAGALAFVFYCTRLAFEDPAKGGPLVAIAIAVFATIATGAINFVNASARADADEKPRDQK